MYISYHRVKNIKLLERSPWNNTERHEKNSTLCNENELGDEYYYIFVCDYFRNERD